MKINKYLILFTALSIFFVSCDDDDPTPENQEELITTLRVTFVDQATQNIYFQVFTDPDGDGGMAPEITTEPLPVDSEFEVDVEFINESVNPPDDITDEVKVEAEEHQVFFVIDQLNLIHEYADEDVNGNPLGIDNRMTTGSAGTGSLRVVLRHEPDKSAQGVSDGDITNAGGETDIDVVFELEVVE